MLKVDENKRGLVRGVIEIQQRGMETIKAHTFWYRHDEQDVQEKLNTAINRLINCYDNHYGISYYLEWKDYTILGHQEVNNGRQRGTEAGHGEVQP